jgi:putative membrane-bound dehydrogenase-like protein
MRGCFRLAALAFALTLPPLSDSVLSIANSQQPNSQSPAAIKTAQPAGQAARQSVSESANQPAVKPATDPAVAAYPAVAADSVDRDYAGELPRIAPREPAEALRTFRVASGFEMQLVAAEPLVTDPIAMAFDEDSRLYVVEMRDYSEDDKAFLGRIRRLEDTDGDGRLDKSIVFAEGLSWPTAVTCYDGGVLVGAPPEIYYLKDTDGDGRADLKQHLFTGFARSNVQGLLNSFQWGLDNRIHGATSSSGAAVLPGPDHPSMKASRDAAPTPIALRGRDFTIDPRGWRLEPASGGAQHGMSLDDWGTGYVCSNSDHLQQVMFEDRYVARNPYLAAPSSRLSIAVDGPQADVFRTSPIEPWRIVRTRLRSKGVIPGIVEGGGRASGYFTSATGVTIYRGDAWPESLRGIAVVGDVGGNLIHRKRIEPNGIPNTGKRIDEKSEFVSSEDIWFRPVQFANAPDGTLYIADMYREVIEHPASLHPVIKKHLDLTSGRDRGRIYRLAPTNFRPSAPSKLSQSSTEELVGWLEHTNGWTRDTASRLLYQRQDRAAAKPLETLARESKRPLGRVHALYALDGLGLLSVETLRTAVRDADPGIRRHAARLSESRLADAPELRESVFALADDADPRVRYQVAFTAGESSGPRRTELLAKLAKTDPANNWMRVAIRSSLAEGSGRMLAALAGDATFRQSPAGRDWLKSLAEQIGKQQRTDDVAELIGALRGIPATETATLQSVLQGLAAKPGSPLAEKVAAATGGRADELTRELVATALKTAIDAKSGTADRLAAVQQLRLGEFPTLEPTLAQLLEPTQPAELQTAALDVLSAFRDPRVAELLVRTWQTLSPRVRSQAADVLFSRPEWILSLLKAVAANTVAVGDVDPGRWRLLADHADPAVRQQAVAVLSQLKVGRRGEVVDAYRDSLKLAGDAARGKEHFKKVCAACHQLQGVGYATGPNLAAMKARGPEAILLNVLDPNREVNPQYLNYNVVTGDGRTLSGMIAAETATSVTLRRAENAADTVLRIDIELLKSTGMSLMPEGLEKQIDKQAMADLLAYLREVE